MATLKISNPQVIGKLKLPAESASKALQINASGEIESSTVTLTELGYLSGVTSAIQTQLGTKALASDLSTHVGNTSNPHSVTKTQVGLSNVQNLDQTDPANIVQDATHRFTNDTAITRLANTSGTNTGDQDLSGLVPKTTTVNGHALSANVTVSASDVGLGNVDNTSDADKPISTATQTALNAKISSTEKGANSGVATLDAGGKVPASQLPNSVMTYEGTFDASAVPAAPLLNGNVGANAGMVYLVSVAGSYDFGAGAITFAVGDWAVYSGTIWEKSINSNTVVSVNGQTGVVSLTKSDVSLGNVDNVQQLPMSYLDTDNTLAANSDAKVASQKAIKAYVANQIGASAHTGDIAHTSFSAANNQVAAANVTGLAFAAGSVRSFKAQVSVSINATTALNEVFDLQGVQLAGGFVMSSSSVGDDSGVVFTITSAGQIQYTSPNSAGFVSNTIKFRASVTDV